MNTEVLSKLVITKVHSVSTLYNPEGTKARRTDRSRWAVVIKYEGETVYTAAGKRYLSDLNHIMILPKSSTYEWQCTSSGHFLTVEFESEQTFPELMAFSVKNGEKILKMLKELEYKRNLKDPLIEMESIRDVYSIIMAIAQTESRAYMPTDKQAKIAAANEYISQNYGKKITNDGLAEIVGLSTVYFRKLFAEIMGVSSISYARQIRIEKAKEMLKSDYGTLSDMALSLGYANLYDFSRDFKKHTGTSPSKYEGR